MAFGFPANHEEQLQLPGPITHEWVGYACHAVGWPVPPTCVPGPRGWTWRTSTGMSLASYGEDITIIAIGPDRLLVRSECALPTQCIDWGRNATNVRRIAEVLLRSMLAAGVGSASAAAGGGPPR